MTSKTEPPISQMARIKMNPVHSKNPICVIRVIRGLTWLALICVCSAACGPTDKNPRYKITGRVNYQGQPVEEGAITFENPAVGEVNSSPLSSGGNYSVQLPAGDYRVSVSPPLVEAKGTGDSPPDMVPKKIKNIPKKYWVQESSGLSAQVAKDKRTFDFDLKP